MSSIILSIQAALGILMSLMILLQTRASGLSQTFGGTGAMVVQRRGAERVLYRGTIFVSIFFFGLTIVEWYVV